MVIQVAPRGSINIKIFFFFFSSSILYFSFIFLWFFFLWHSILVNFLTRVVVCDHFIKYRIRAFHLFFFYKIFKKWIFIRIYSDDVGFLVSSCTGRVSFMLLDWEFGPTWFVFGPLACDLPFCLFNWIVNMKTSMYKIWNFFD